MAYVTGVSNSLTDLLTAIQNACTANGWTLSGSVLHKGTCYIEMVVTTISLSTVIAVRGGTGIDGSNNLTGASNAQSSPFAGVMSGTLGSDLVTEKGSQNWSWPATYFIHINTAPDEIYVIVNYATRFYQTLAFGQSAMPGLVGTGNWFCGVGSRLAGSATSYGIHSGGEEHFGSSTTVGFSLFCRGAYCDPTFGIDHEMDGMTWGGVRGSAAGSAVDWASLAFRQPNQWNQESILMPIRVYASRLSGFISPVLECAHARFVVLSNLTDQQVITLGADKWKVYPWWSRGAPYSSGGGGTYTGQFGHAFRYDGP